MLADPAVLLVERVMGGHKPQDAARLQAVQGLHEEEVREREQLPPMLQLHVAEGRIADDRVDLGEPRVAETLDANLVLGI